MCGILYECPERHLPDCNINVYQSNKTTLETSFYVYIDICSVMNTSLSKKVPFYSIVTLLSICKEQLIECLDPGYRLSLSFNGKFLFSRLITTVAIDKVAFRMSLFCVVLDAVS